MIGRHLFASHGSSFDLAWTTMGSSAELDGARCGRLEEQVPWGSRLVDAVNPPLLTGDVDRVLDPDNLVRLPQAFFPMDGRLGFSVWGAVAGDGAGSGVGGAATHTLLFDHGAFEAVAGFPLGLLAIDPADPSRLPAWLVDLASVRPTSHRDLTGLRVPSGPVETGLFQQAFDDQVHALRGWLCEGRGEAGLARDLGRVYLALAEALRGGRPSVALSAKSVDPTKDANSGDSGTFLRNLILLAWLGLPMADRRRVFYTTAPLQGRDVRPFLTPFDPVAPASERVEVVELSDDDPPASWLTTWAGLVASGSPRHRRALVRLESRAWSVLTPEHAPSVLGTFVSSPANLRESLSPEALERTPGALAYFAVRSLDQVSGDEVLEALLKAPVPAHRERRFWAGALRGLTAEEVPGAPPALVAEIGLRNLHRRGGLSLAVSGMRGLAATLETDLAPLLPWVNRAVEGVRQHSGEGEAVGMARLCLALIESDETSALAFLRALPPSIATSGHMLADIGSLLTKGADNEAWGGFFRDLWPTVSRRVEENGADRPYLDAVETLLLMEIDAFGSSQLQGPLVQRVLSGTPPLPVFLALRPAAARGGRAPVSNRQRSESGVLPVLSSRSKGGPR